MSEREALQQLNLCRGRGIPQIVGYDRGGFPIYGIEGGADGIYYRDLRTPFVIADLAATTLGTTQKCLWPVGVPSVTVLPANYWTVGKTVKLTAFLKWTAVASTNAITFGMQFGAADANACNVISDARATVSSTTVFSVFAEGYATCRSTGTAGTLSMFGRVSYPVGLVAAATGPDTNFPIAGVTVVSTTDTSLGTGALSFQALRATSGTDTVLATNIYMEALN